MDVFLFKYISNEKGLEILDAWKLNPGILWVFLNFIYFTSFYGQIRKIFPIELFENGSKLTRA